MKHALLEKLTVTLYSTSKAIARNNNSFMAAATVGSSVFVCNINRPLSTNNDKTHMIAHDAIQLHEEKCHDHQQLGSLVIGLLVEYNGSNMQAL